MEEEALWIKQQRKAFTGWCNSHLSARNLNIEDLDTDLETGVLFWNLLEIISTKKLNKLESANPKTKFQKVGNLSVCFRFMEQEKLKLVNIGPEDIFSGNRKLILGLIWTLILRYQIQRGLQSSSGVHRNVLSDCFRHFVSKTCRCFSFKDGKAFCALVNYLKSNSVSATGNPVIDCSNAFDAANTQFQIPKLLDAELVTNQPDELSIMTYVSFFKSKEPERPAQPEPAISARNSTLGVEGKTQNGKYLTGHPVTFIVTIKDEDDQIVTTPESIVFLTVDGTPVVMNGLKGEFTPQHPGIYTAEAQLSGQTIGNAVTLQVHQSVDAKQCSLEGPNLKEATKNKPAVFFLLLNHEKGNPVPFPVDPSRVEVNITTSGKSVPVKLSMETPHKIRVDYTPESACKYEIVVKVDGQPVPQSPVALTVYPETIDTLQITGHEGLEGMVDQETSFWVQSSIPTMEWSPLTATITDNQGAIIMKPKDTGNGTQMVFRPAKAGKHTVHVSYGGNQVQGSPFEIMVWAAPSFERTDLEVHQTSMPESSAALQKLYDEWNSSIYVAESNMVVLVTLKNRDSEAIPIIDLPAVCKKLKVMVAGPFASQKDATASTIASEKKTTIPASPLDATTFKASIDDVPPGVYRVALIDPNQEGVTHKGVFFTVAAPFHSSNCTVEGTGLTTVTPEHATASRNIKIRLNGPLDELNANKIAQVITSVEFLTEDKETILASHPVPVTFHSNTEATYNLDESIMNEIHQHHEKMLDAGYIRLVVQVHVFGTEIPGSPFYVSFDLPPIEEPEVLEAEKASEAPVKESIQECLVEKPRDEEPKPKAAASPSRLKPPTAVKKTATTPVKKTVKSKEIETHPQSPK